VRARCGGARIFAMFDTFDHPGARNGVPHVNACEVLCMSQTREPSSDLVQKWTEALTGRPKTTRAAARSQSVIVVRLLNEVPTVTGFWFRRYPGLDQTSVKSRFNHRCPTTSL
jgi:hypothetical protein